MTDFRTGFGLDFHRLIRDAARPLMLGGVEIPGELALEGHSDADVALHALADALLGALGLGDIGEFFPDTDANLKNMDSTIILAHARDAALARGFRIANIDLTFIGETPRLKAHKPAIRARLAELLALEPDRVGLKATTTEKMGALGRSEGVGCAAVVALIKP
jgi:2-C-methyl-D-erythritol 2,4-cyclodiphosphate synthase